MAGRATSELLLVGSLPAASTEEALRAGGELFGDLVFALPDGETGPRALWAGYEHERSAPERGHRGRQRPRRRGHAAPRRGDRRCSRVRDGVERAALRRAGRASTTRSSPTRSFRALRDEGVDPRARALPGRPPVPHRARSTLQGATSRATSPIAAAGLEELVARELERLTEAIPPDDLAHPVGRLLGGARPRGRHRVDGRTTPGSASPARSRGSRRLIPEEVLVGYHLCYGTFPTGRCTRPATWRCW